MAEGWNIAILGATGAVGEALLSLLEERQFPFGALYLLASERSAGTTLRVNQTSYVVQDAATFDWSQAHMAFFVAGKTASLSYAEEAANSGCLVIDSSGLFALELDVPLIVPGVNSEQLVEYRNRNLIAVANSLSSQLLRAIKPLIDQAGITQLHVTHFLPASLHGKAVVEELAGQSARLLNGVPIEEGFFTKQLAFNLLPFAVELGENVELEQQVVDEVRKILQDNGLPIATTCIQSPVFYGQAQIVHFDGIRPISAEEAGGILSNVAEVNISDSGDYPTQVGEATGSSILSIGCLRNDYGMPNLLQFWSVADNIRFSGGLMALEIAEQLIEEYL